MNNRSPPARAFPLRKRDALARPVNLILVAVTAVALLLSVRYSRIRTARGLARRLGVDALLGYPQRTDVAARRRATHAAPTHHCATR